MNRKFNFEPDVQWPIRGETNARSTDVQDPSAAGFMRLLHG